MPAAQQKYYRRSIRLRDYDYSQPGFYYVTICTKDKKLMFGEIVNGEMYLNEAGSIVESTWNAMPERVPSVKLDEYIIMPNHLHGIIELVEGDTDPVGKTGRAVRMTMPEKGLMNQARERKRASLGEIIRTFKGASSYFIRTRVRVDFAWQEDYYEHVVRNDKDLGRIRQYILDNPARWGDDRFYSNVC